MPQSNILAEVKHTLTPIRDLLFEDEDPFREYRGQTALNKIKVFFFGLFPILRWGMNYKLSDLTGDIIGGLTIASLAVPQVCFAMDHCSSPDDDVCPRGK